MKLRLAILLFAVMALFLLFLGYVHTQDAEGLTRAQTARMLAWTLLDMEKEEFDSQISKLIDVDENLWYADEINAVVSNNLMETDGDLFHPTDLLTYNEAQTIAKNLGLMIDVPFLKGKQAISIDDWLVFYDKLIEAADTVERETMTIEATPATSETLSAWQVQTCIGVFNCEGLSADSLIGQKVIVYVSGKELLMAVAIDSGTAEYTDTGQTSEVIEVGNMGGNDEATELTDDNGVKSSETDADVIEGEKGLETDPSNEIQIRVCLMTTDYTSEYHDSVMLMADTAWYIKFEDSIRECLPGETVTLTVQDFDADGEIAEISSSEGGKIQLLSVKRSYGFPEYKGVLRVIKEGDQLLVINVLPLENYLCGVLPAEMPADYGSEALKAQAVCARSYAWRMLLAPKYDFADVNDSTACQVYMNQEQDDRCTQAVNATAGQVLVCENQVVTAKYFSTSCGSLSASSDVWLYEDETDEIAGTKALLETLPVATPDLADETSFKQFIDEPEADLYIEANETWFRWQLAISLEDIGDNIENYLKKRMAVNPKHFTILSENGEINADDISGMEIIERASSGVVKKIRIYGENQELTVSGEYNIRCLLAPNGETQIYMREGSRKVGMSLLPSGYFYLEAMTEDETIIGYTVHGGGLGHGVGMSQNGARIFDEMGYDYQEILSYYFQNISIESAGSLD